MNQKDDKQPRLLIVVNVFHPDRGGGGAIFTDLARGLAERGFDVTVRCAYPYYPEWQDKSGKNGIPIDRYDEYGVHVERYGIFIPSRPNSLIQRLVYEASFFFSLLRSLHRGRFDMVMVFCPLVGAVGFATLNKWLHRKPLWLNIQDLSADAAAAGGIARGKLVRALLGGVQGGLFNQAQVWSSISPVMIQRLQAIRRKNQPILYLPNWLNASMAAAIQQQEDKSGQLPHDPVRLLYAGNIGSKQDLPRFCETLHASAASFHFRIHGDGGYAGTVRDWVEQTKDDRFSFGPFLDEPAFAEALHDTDFFVITEKSGSGGSFIPCKMIPGMASGSVILAVSDAESPLGREMTAERPGPWFSWDDLASVPSMLTAIHENPAQFADWQANARRRAEFHERNRVISRFETAIRSIVAHPKSIPSDLADI
ncbi:MAG TPA: glycosyltransferase [Candidatus Hydrogenedentes bacterium]|nr:glycosyltransferase [Candidatus Hydrogenedentota bacterium]